MEDKEFSQVEMIGFLSRCILFSWIPFHGSISLKKESYPNVLKRYCQTTGFCFWLLLQYRKFWFPVYGLLFPRVQPFEAEVIHRCCAGKVKQFCKDKGGLFIKLGQYAACLHNVLPKEYLQELATLEDHAEECPIQDVLQVIERELGPFRSLLTNISERPIGCASIAQVHTANLLMSSTVVAIKVQKPNIPMQFAQDVRMLHILLSMYQTFKGGYDPTVWNIFVEFMREIQQEMNFVNERANNRKLAQCFQENDHIHVPHIFPCLSSRRVLTMEYIDGMTIDQCLSFDKEIRFRIARTLHEAFAKMLFQHRFLHMDPHPGNILLQWPQDNNHFRLVLIDTGKCQYVDSDFMEKFANFIVAVFLRDAQRLSRLLRDIEYGELLASLFLGRKITRSWLHVDDEAAATIANANRKKYSVQDYIHIVTWIQPEWLTILRPFLVIRGISRKLGYPKDVSRIYAPFALQLVWKTWSRNWMFTGTVGNLGSK